MSIYLVIEDKSQFNYKNYKNKHLVPVDWSQSKVELLALRRSDNNISHTYM